MILHIPHSSTNTLNKAIIRKERELLRMTDHFTDDLYNAKEATRIVFGVSRLVCDVERFQDDAQESMSRFGMGVCYTTNSDGEQLREVSEEDKQQILEKYYRPHHQRLSDLVDEELAMTGKALVVDCHSFPDTSYYFNSDYNKTRPEVCIGTDSFHTPKKVVEETKKFFLSKGYVVKVDSPYSGTMVPIKHYKKDKRVSSIMIEVNRKLYMDDNGLRNKNYDKLKYELEELLENIQKEF